MIEISPKNSEEYYIRYTGNSIQEFLDYTEILGDIKNKYFDFMYRYWVCDRISAQKIQDELNNIHIGERLKLRPYGYQRQAIKACLDSPGLLIQLPCGSGKTPIGLGIYESLRHDDKIKQGIFVVKASLKSQWLNEVSKFTDFSATIVDTYKSCTSKISAQIKRKEIKVKQLISKSATETVDEIYNLENELETLNKNREDIFISQFSSEYDIFIINYETLADERVKEEFHKLNIQFFYVDEVDCIKDCTTKRSINLREFSKAKYKFGATATPIRKNPKDIFGIFSFINTDLFPNEREFENRYTKKWMGRITGSKNEKELADIVNQHKFVRTFDQIADQLPNQLVIKQFCHLTDKQIEMTNILMNEIADFKKEQEKLAKTLPQEVLLVNPEYEKLNANIAARQTFAQMLADSEELLINSGSRLAKEYITKDSKYSAKVELCLELVQRIIESGEKLCIFSKFIGVQDIIGRHLDELKKDNELYGYSKIYGNVSDKERHEIIKEYNTSKTCNILMLSDAGEAGLNLSSTKYMIEFDLADSAAKQTQRHGRIQRADSVHKNVIVYQLIAEKSYDEIASRIIEKKAKYADEIL